MICHSIYELFLQSQVSNLAVNIMQGTSFQVVIFRTLNFYAQLTT